MPKCHFRGHPTLEAIPAIEKNVKFLKLDTSAVPSRLQYYEET
jgi:hypothetical protein